MGRGVSLQDGAAVRRQAPAAPDGWDKLVAAVGRITEEAQRAWSESRPRMTAYRQEAAHEVLAQLPYATRIAGERAWKSRGRKLRAGARPLEITTAPPKLRWLHPQTGEELPKTLWPYCGPKGRRPSSLILAALPTESRLQALKVLRAAISEEVDRAHKQKVFDISDTEPLEGTSLNSVEEEHALAGIAAVQRAAHKVGCRVLEPSDSAADDTLVCAARETLLQERDCQGAAIKLKGHGVIIAQPEGLEGAERLRVMAHELGHVLLGHLDTPPQLRRLQARDHEIQAESFAYLICRRFGLESTASPHYVVNHTQGRDAQRALERNLRKVASGLEIFEGKSTS